MDVSVFFFCISYHFLLAKTELKKPEKIVFSPSELISTDVISNSSLKAALRYGFHRTYECKDFEKAYICVRKCVDLRYDLAYSDKYCFCTCYHKKEKAKYTTRALFDKTNWKLGAPTTTKPAWAVSNKELKDIHSLESEGEHEGDHEKDTTVNPEENNTTNTLNDMNETNTAGSDTNATDVNNSLDKGNATDVTNPADSGVADSTGGTKSDGAEGSTGVPVNPTDSSG